MLPMMTVKMIHSRGNERRNHVVSRSRGVIDAFNAQSQSKISLAVLHILTSF